MRPYTKEHLLRILNDGGRRIYMSDTNYPDASKWASLLMQDGTVVMIIKGKLVEPTIARQITTYEIE